MTVNIRQVVGPAFEVLRQRRTVNTRRAMGRQYGWGTFKTGRHAIDIDACQR